MCCCPLRQHLLREDSGTVFLEELTWTEVRDAIKAGKTTIIFPTGGTEQNGPHMVLGKHNFIVKHAAEQIARRLGNALVAPVLAYVPEGNIDPPSGHMLYPGTISLPDDVFIKVTEYAARSFRANGFKDIVLIGDSGGNQKGLQSVANFAEQGMGEDRRTCALRIGVLQGESLPRMVARPGRETRRHRYARRHRRHLAVDGGEPEVEFAATNSPLAETAMLTGVTGNPARASVAYGKKGLEMKIEAAVAQIRKLVGARGG